jgi:hypothetical protein
MKKLITLIVFACLYGRADAQIIDTLPWCPPGATWVYYSSPGFGANLYFKFTYQKDTLINNHIAKLLEVHSVLYTGGFGVPWVRTTAKVGQEYLYQSNDSIYWFDDNRYKFIYSFAPIIGSNYEISNARAYCQGNSTYPTSDTISVVSSFFPYTRSGRTFTLYRTSQNSYWQMGTIIKNIGGLDAPFPYINHMLCNNPEAEYGSYYEDLVCYRDSLRGSIEFNPTGLYDCYDLITSTYEPPTLYKPLFTYPNPVIDVLHVDIKGNNVKKIVVYDILGNVVLTDESRNNQLSMINMPAGVYVIRATNLNDDHYIGKIIKQ